MDSHLRRLAAAQAEVVAAWQLRAAGWTPKRIHHHAATRGWRRIHPGVYALTQGAPTQLQLWWAATLTAPDTFLSHGSAGACQGFYRFHKPFEVVTRPGQGGRRRQGGIVVFRSKHLDGETTRHMGIPITTAERTLADLAPHLHGKRLGRALREAVRLQTTTMRKVLRCAEGHPQGTAELCRLASRYAEIPYHRTRSDAEALGLEVLLDAGVELPLVNVEVAGQEADYTWLKEKRIIEIDGPQFHKFKDQDARKTSIWRKAGFDVRRIGSDAIYDEPHELIALARD